MENMDRKSDSQMTEAQNKYVSPFLLIMYLLSTVILILSLFTIAITILVFMLRKLNLRKLLYPSCICAGILVFIAFILAALASMAVVGTHFGC